MTDDQIDADPELVRLVKQDPGRRLDLQTGNPGESYWHAMPEDLRSEWEAFVAGYEVPDYGDDLDSFDGPCFWLDLETRQCKHHQYRPQVCRDFDAGSSECHQWRDHYRDKILSPFEFSIQQKRANRHASKITEPSTPGRE